MALSNNFEQVECRLLKIDRATRQRVEIDTEDLKPSIRRLGVIQAIIAERPSMMIIAGERRWRASVELGIPTIPVRWADTLDPIERKVIELEENLKRTDLAWADECRAVAELHMLYCQMTPGWTQTQTGEQLSITQGYLSMIVRVQRDLASERIANAPNLRAAYNMLARVDDRRLGDIVSDLADIDPAAKIEPKPAPAPIQPGSGILATPPVEPAPMPTPPVVPLEAQHILLDSFLDWAPKYEGPKFSFLHCDFPYGKNVFKGELSGRDKWHTYDDDPEIYWKLIDCLCVNIDRLMAYSSHLMFWLSADIETMSDTLKAFRHLAPSLAFQPKSLIWTKSDNVGVLADPKRGPRHIYETALIACRGDRPIVRAVSDSYSAPTDKAHHHSTKPEPVLKHFFGMFVDEQSTILDPTCGSGSSLRAAEALGAKSVLGLEVDAEHCRNARSALKAFRSLRKAANGAR